MPPKCKTCLDPNVGQINTLLKEGVSFRNIAKQVGSDGSYSSIVRHAEHLGLEMGVIVKEKLVKQAINVHDEFGEQLQFAKRLRTAAEEYLSHPDDPLRLVLMPRADEIEVVYYDNNDLTDGDRPKPKKKSGDLQTLLYSLAAPDSMVDEYAKDTAKEKLVDVGDPDQMFEETWDAARRYFVQERQSIDREADKVTIKHVDLRKFALDAINTTDTCIDKFAKLTGAYQQDKPNDRNVEEEFKLLLQRIQKRAEVNKTSVEYEVKAYLGANPVAKEVRAKLEMVSEAVN